MCDTILTRPAVTACGRMLFGKNSDRQRNEAQAVETHPARRHRAGQTLRCTHIVIPQVRRTQAVLLCRPFWAWGAEMGVNEHGVAIGNEAVHARISPSVEPGLVGMDLVRLGLERAATAAEAVEVITALIGRHGQGGDCGHLTPSHYHNAFMVADGCDAFVVETMDREWVVERAGRLRSLSNVYSIGRNVEEVSQGLFGALRALGWSGDSAPDVAEVLADPDREHIGCARARRTRSAALLRARSGEVTVADMITVLRDHGGAGDAEEPLDRITICMHAGDEAKAGQTVGSLVAELAGRDSLCWVTATAAPCLSIFKPLLPGAPVPPHGAPPSDTFDPQALWWRHELLHRAALEDSVSRLIQEIGEERDALEARFRREMSAALDDTDLLERRQAMAACWQAAAGLEAGWLARVSGSQRMAPSPALATWRAMSRLAGMPG